KAELYRRAWLHVTASASEGWSLTVMEAALCATPSVAMRVGGQRESIVERQTGVLADSPAQLRDAVAELLRDHALRERLGQAAHEAALAHAVRAKPHAPRRHPARQAPAVRLHTRLDVDNVSVRGTRGQRMREEEIPSVAALAAGEVADRHMTDHARVERCDAA